MYCTFVFYRSSRRTWHSQKFLNISAWPFCFCEHIQSISCAYVFCFVRREYIFSVIILLIKTCIFLIFSMNETLKSNISYVQRYSIPQNNWYVIKTHPAKLIWKCNYDERTNRHTKEGRTDGSKQNKLFSITLMHALLIYGHGLNQRETCFMFCYLTFRHSTFNTF